MGKVIAVTAGKGGCGKTMLTASLGYALAECGKKVCLADVCAGMRGLDIALNLQDRVVYDLYDLCAEDCTMEQALLRTEKENLRLIAAPQMHGMQEMLENGLRKALERLKKRFDYVLLDTPSLLFPAAEALCETADETVLVTMPGDAAARCTERAASLLRQTPDACLWLLYNAYDARRAKAVKLPAPDAEAAYLDIPLLGVVPLHEAAFLPGALDHKRPSQYPEKLRAAALNAARRLCGEQLPLKNDTARRFPWLF